MERTNTSPPATTKPRTPSPILTKQLSTYPPHQPSELQYELEKEDTIIELPWFSSPTSPTSPRTYDSLSTSDFPLEKKQSFLIALARDFAIYGAPAHRYFLDLIILSRLEHHLESVSSSLGLSGSSFFILPGLILIQFQSKNPARPKGNFKKPKNLRVSHMDDIFITSSVHLVKIPPPKHHLAKLSAVNSLCREIQEDDLSIQDAWRRLLLISTCFVYDLSDFKDGLRDPSRSDFRDAVGNSTQTFASRMLRYCSRSYPIKSISIVFPIISFTGCLIFFDGIN
jgi:hypothetical protein